MKPEIRLDVQVGLEARLALEVCGVATATLFPQVEALLLSNEEFQKALKYVSRTKKMDRYRSLVDFFFCELFPQYQYRCFRFYRGGGPQLREVIEVRELMSLNRALLLALGLARELYRDGALCNWAWFRGTLKKALRMEAEGAFKLQPPPVFLQPPAEA